MNVVKVQFEIHDVVREEPKKSATRRPQSAPFSQRSPEKNKTANSVNINSKAKQASNTIESKYVPQNDTPVQHCPLPQKPSFSSHHQTRRNPHRTPLSDKPDWNASLTVPDRDLLIINQDLEVAKFRDTHNFFEDDAAEHHKPEPVLSEFKTRKQMKHLESEEHRDRWVHHSFGAVANDPLPFYKHLHETSGIHGNRWRNDASTTVSFDDWAKPAAKVEKTQEDFQRNFRIHPKPVPLQDIRKQRSIASIDSSYTKAEMLLKGKK